jgi:uncharacterized C2H2 Zn-finger protein
LGFVFVLDVPEFSIDDLGELISTKVIKLQDGKGFMCQICGTVVKRKNNMQRHFYRRHITGLVYACPVCCGGYKSKHNLWSHIDKMHKGWKGTVDYDQCLIRK